MVHDSNLDPGEERPRARHHETAHSVPRPEGGYGADAAPPENLSSTDEAAGIPDRGETGPTPQQEPERGARPGDSEKKKAGSRFRRALGETLFILLIAVIVAILIQAFFLKAFLIPSSSMSPTLMIGDRVMVERATFYFRKPHRGDIVVFRYPPREPAALNTTNIFYLPIEQIGEVLHLAHRGETAYVKRVVATEGDTVQLKGGKLYINGKKIMEKYIVNDGSVFGPVKVPKGMLFCMGDNRGNSSDSRFWGPVPVRSVIGRVFFRWWPPSRMGRPR